MASATACLHRARALRVIVSLPLVNVVLAVLSSLVRCSASLPLLDLARVSFLPGATRDRVALLAFKSSLVSGDPLEALASWNETSPLCSWRGVTCGSRRHPKRVTELHLQSLRLSGPIPTSVANLTFLKRLALSDNGFYGHIPEELGRLSRLRHLNMSVNSLTGSIPVRLGHCCDLRDISLSYNKQTGTIPTSLSNLSSLQILSLEANRLGGHIPAQFGNLSSLATLLLHNNTLSGAIPSSLGTLSSLEKLVLRENHLEGGIPPTLGYLSSLSVFYASKNMLTGTIPSSVYNISSLVFFDLGDNQLTGTLPPDIGILLPNLQFLSLYENRLHGFIPSSIVNASSLWSIQLNDNKFSGIIPSRLGNLKALEVLLLGANEFEAKDDDDWSFLTSLTNCTRLRKLDLSQNKLMGVLPSAISNLSTDLIWLGLFSNRISGSIPEDFENLRGLNVLQLQVNLLTGLIPNSLGKLHELVVLSLEGNEFSGQLPSSMSNLTKLTHLVLANNKLEGGIPPSLGKLRNLLELDLSYNKLSGNIPKELVSISSLSIVLDLSQNALVGVLPSEVGHLRNLNVLDVSQNQLSGDIPSMLGDCEVLEHLLMHGNAFRGSIPQSFSKLGGLQSLDLSQNHLFGEIPGFFQNLHSLNYLNLSFNDFNGELPKGGIFENASAVFVQGNHRLCGGIQEFHLQTCFSKESRGHARRIKLIAITIVVGVSLCLLTLVLYMIFSRYTRRKVAVPLVPSNDLFVRATYAQLFKATDGFSSENLIGVGSFGSVYKANMDSTGPNGQLVAVKVINLLQRGALKSFMAECEAFKVIRHRNLLKIMTTCSSIDFNGNDFKALVLDFMPRGSLEQWLHPQENEKGEKLLSLLQRLNIAIDVASALAYLHHQCFKTIIHGDIKPSNVLLDNQMIGHVSDFGLAKSLNNNDEIENSTSSLALRGSIGYIAPEYGMGCNATIEGDVFSYGIILLEMVTGRKPTDASFTNNLTLHKFVEMAFLEHLLDIVEPYLLIEDKMSTYNICQDTNNMRQARLSCLVSMARLGLMCSKESPKERLGMEVVIKELTTLKDTWDLETINE